MDRIGIDGGRKGTLSEELDGGYQSQFIRQ